MPSRPLRGLNMPGTQYALDDRYVPFVHKPNITNALQHKLSTVKKEISTNDSIVIY